jgi:hypothetical protein
MTTLKKLWITRRGAVQGRLAGSRNDGSIAEVHTVVLRDWYMIIGQIAKKIGILNRLVRAFWKKSCQCSMCVCVCVCVGVCVCESCAICCSPLTSNLYTWYRPLILHMLPASIRRIIGWQWWSTFNTFPPAGIWTLKSTLPAHFKGTKENLKSMVFPVIIIIIIIIIRNFYTP